MVINIVGTRGSCNSPKRDHWASPLPDDLLSSCRSANVLMLPAVPYAMVFGALASVAGMLWLPLGQLLALLAWLFVHWLIVVSRLLAHVRGAYTTLPPFCIEWVWGWYLVISEWYVRFVAVTSPPMKAEAGCPDPGSRTVWYTPA